MGYLACGNATSPVMPGPALTALVKDWDRCMADEEEQGLWRLTPEDLHLPSHVQARMDLALDHLERMQQEADEHEKEVEAAKGHPSRESDDACTPPPAPASLRAKL